MRISPINYYNNLKQNTSKADAKPSFNYYASGTTTPKSIAFSGGLDYFINKLSKNPLKHFKNFSIQEYNNLSPSAMCRLRKEYQKLQYTDPYLYTTMADVHNFAATAMQVVFDSRFGKNNYVVIPIGRSLSSIGKVLGYRIGENNVINIPMSDAKRFSSSLYSRQYKECIQNIKSGEKLDDLLKYLNTHNLSRKDIETGGKNYILTDYCVSGLSLDGAEQLLKSELVWGNKKNNIYSVDFIKLLDNITYDQNSLPNPLQIYTNINRKIKNTLYESEYKQFSFVGTANYFSSMLAASPERIIPFADKATKLAWFHLLDTEMQYKGVNKYSIQLSEKKPLSELSGQKVEPWNDILSQYEYDLRNDLMEVNKTIMKFEEINFNDISPRTEKQYRKNRLNLYSIYNTLAELYRQNSNTSKISNYYLFKQKTIDELKKINEYLEK